MFKRFTHLLGPLMGACLFFIALAVLHRASHEYGYHQIAAALRAIPRNHIALAVCCTVGSYLALTCYDLLALRYIKRNLPLHKVMLTSFIGYAFSHNIGFAFLSGGSVRYRLYSSWSLSAVDIAKVVTFCTITGALGFTTLSGLALVFEPVSLLQSLNAPPGSLRIVGGVFLLAVLAYLTTPLWWRHPIVFHGVTFRFPSVQLTFGQLAATCTDLAFASGVLYVLLPDDAPISYIHFVGVFLLAIVGGVLSQVPGGVGVIEGLIVLMMSSIVQKDSLFASLLAFRAIYYILPLLTSATLLGGYELYQRKTHVARLVKTVGPWVPATLPKLFAMLIFITGAGLLLSGSIPTAHSRMEWLDTWLPFPFIEASHFVTSVIGVLMLLLARGLERRLDAAFLVTAGSLLAGMVTLLLRGAEYEHAFVLAVLLGALAGCRPYFNRKASLFQETFSPGWIISIMVVILSAIWLGFFSYKHLDYSSDMWWSFTLHGDAPRFLRTTVGIVVILFLVTVSRLLAPARPRPTAPTDTELDEARQIIAQSDQAAANLALTGDKALLFNESRTAFIMYAAEGRSWVSMGSPVGASKEFSALLWQYYEICDQWGGWPVFYQVPPEHLPLYLDMGMAFLKLGEEARVSLTTFSLEGSTYKTLRNTINRLEREGYSFEIVPCKVVAEILPQMKVVSEQWKENKHTREKAFSLGRFDEKYLCNFPHAIVKKDNTVIAFANLWANNVKDELSIDLMRYVNDAPNGVMDFLFVKTMVWGREQGYQWFNLGMAPLSGLEKRALAPLWTRVGNLVYRHGEHFYNFRGLRQYKEKFDPVWQPRYLAYPGGFSLPVILANISALISGGLKGVVMR